MSRFIQGMIRDPEVMKASEVNKFFRISTHIRKEKCATLCMVRGMNDVSVERSFQKQEEKIVEGVEERLTLSPTESTLIDPVSYLASR